MPPKEQRQPEVKQDPVDKAHEPEPAWVAALFKRLEIVDDKVTKLNPRIDALEDKMATRNAGSDSSDDESDHRSNRSKDDNSRNRRRGRSRSRSRERRRSRDNSRQRCRNRSYDHGDTYKDRRPRFRTDSLTPVRYGDDVATWLVEMDHIVLKHGEEIVCPEIFGHCFQSGDAIKLWYMGLDPDLRRLYTTGSGCWQRFRNVMERRFTADVGLRQLAAEDRSRLPDETYAEFAIKKVALIRTSFAHLDEGAMIAMVKRKLDWEAARFCREKTTVNAFVSELIEYDNLRDMQTGRRQPQAPTRLTQQGHGQQHAYGPQSYPPQSSGPRAYEQKLEQRGYPFGHDYRDESRWTQQGHGQQHAYGPQSYAPHSSGPRDYENKLERRGYPFEHDYRDESARVPPTQFQPQQPAAPYRQPTGAQALRATGSNAVYVDPRLSTIQPRKHPHTGIDTLSYLDRSGKAVFLQRPCGHCEAMGKKNVWHFDFSCANKSAPSGRRDRAYAGDAALPGTVESPSGHPTSYTFSGFANV
jgi:hypothetical protein